VERDEKRGDIGVFWEFYLFLGLKLTRFKEESMMGERPKNAFTGFL
jgi:hypothetical protein